MSSPVDVDNLEMLKELIGDDLKDILGAFISTAPDLVTKMDNALFDKDGEELRMHAHSMKGSAANIGATELSSLSANLEELAKNGNMDSEANGIFNQVKTENANVMTFLNNYIQQF